MTRLRNSGRRTLGPVQSADSTLGASRVRSKSLPPGSRLIPRIADGSSRASREYSRARHPGGHPAQGRERRVALENGAVDLGTEAEEHPGILLRRRLALGKHA
jgi:hypothetical protein